MTVNFVSCFKLIVSSNVLVGELSLLLTIFFFEEYELDLSLELFLESMDCTEYFGLDTLWRFEFLEFFIFSKTLEVESSSIILFLS